MIQNRQLTLATSRLADAGSLPETLSTYIGRDVLRWYIARITPEETIIEVTTDDEQPDRVEARSEIPYYPGKSAVLNVVPTGVGCTVGGYAGDAAPVTNLLAATADYVITNPNALNASDFIGLDSQNIIYTDGRSMDLFSQGAIELYLPYANRIGLVIETCEEWKLEIVLNLVNAVRAVHGVNIVDYVITDEPIRSRCIENQSGAFVGTVDNPHALFSACEKLMSRGANAIAVTTAVEDLPLDNYAKHFDGEYPNPVGGVEAIISYLISSRFQVPTAHAPLLNTRQLELKHRVVDARGAAEMSSASGLACILIGLKRAPQLKAKPDCRIHDIVNINNLLAVVMPASCLGGIPTIYAQRYGVPVIAVEENRTILDVTQDKLRLNNAIKVHSYAEAAGVVSSLRRGISIESISRPLKTLR